MNILLIGPQGSGKGTQARLLCDKFHFSYFEAGAFLRNMAEKNENLRKSLAEGRLVPDEEMSSYVTAHLDENGLYDNILFDGFPRTLDQYKAFKRWAEGKKVKLNLVILLTISEAETIRRLSARRQDPATGKIYNLITDKPPAEVDTSSLVQRDDDKPEAIGRRLSIYKEQTEPMIAELKKVTDVVETNGERPIEIILQDLTREVEERMK
jgi:adenylate kinase